ncbi:MAG TPA: hypothetical protein VFY95_08050 [Sphingomicrobium sp.]
MATQPIRVNVTPKSMTSTRVDCAVAGTGVALPPGVEIVDNSIFLAAGTGPFQLIFQLQAGPGPTRMTWDQDNPFTTSRGGCPTGIGSVNNPPFAVTPVAAGNTSLTVDVAAGPAAKSVYSYRMRLRDGGNKLRSCDPVIIRD